jgi:hypothetical protein
MSVCGCAHTKVRMGGVCSPFNKAADYDRCKNAMRVLDSTEGRQFPGLQPIAVACADLGAALGEADTVHLSSLWKRRSAWPKPREIIDPNDAAHRGRSRGGQSRGPDGATFRVPLGPMLPRLIEVSGPSSTRYHSGPAPRRLLHALTGYLDRPNGVQLSLYLATVAVIGSAVAARLVSE